MIYQLLNRQPLIVLLSSKVLQWNAHFSDRLADQHPLNNELLKALGCQNNGLWWNRQNVTSATGLCFDFLLYTDYALLDNEWEKHSLIWSVEVTDKQFFSAESLQFWWVVKLLQAFFVDFMHLFRNNFNEPCVNDRRSLHSYITSVSVLWWATCFLMFVHTLSLFYFWKQVLILR